MSEEYKGYSSYDEYMKKTKINPEFREYRRKLKALEAKRDKIARHRKVAAFTKADELHQENIERMLDSVSEEIRLLQSSRPEPRVSKR